MYIEDEIIQTPDEETIEEDLSFDLKSDSLVTVTNNVIQYPLFSKRDAKKINQIIKYIFNDENYMSVAPQAGDYVPGEEEEVLFIALINIMKKKGGSKKFIFSQNDLKKELGIKSEYYIKELKKCLERLATASYGFINTFYTEKNQKIKQEIRTKMMSLRIITLKNNRDIEVKKYLTEKDIKEVYEVNFLDHFYEFIIKNNYENYNSKKILELNDGISRNLFIYLNKIKEKREEIILDVDFLIKKIPILKKETETRELLEILIDALNELKKSKDIYSFEILKNKKIKIEFKQKISIGFQQTLF